MANVPIVNDHFKSIVGFMKYSQDNLMIYLGSVFVSLALLYILFRYRPGVNIFYYILVASCYLMLEKYIWICSLTMDQNNTAGNFIITSTEFKTPLLMFLTVDILFFYLFVPMIFQTYKKITIKYDEFALKLVILCLFRHFIFNRCELIRNVFFLSFPILDLFIPQQIFYVCIYLIYKHLKKNRVL